MTDSSWFEVTPERVAQRIAERIFTIPTSGVILDAFCGIGGNSIQFALRPSCTHVIALDSDPLAIFCAKKNAQLYGVAHKITFLAADFFHFASNPTSPEYTSALSHLSLTSIDVVFASPPWGGPSYRTRNIFNLENDLKPYPFSRIWEAAQKLSPNGSFMLPRTSDLRQLAGYLTDDEVMGEAVHYCLDMRSKALVFYVGGLVESGRKGKGKEKKKGSNVHEEGELSSLSSSPTPAVVQQAEEVWRRVAGVGGGSGC